LRPHSSRGLFGYSITIVKTTGCAQRVRLRPPSTRIVRDGKDIASGGIFECSSDFVGPIVTEHNGLSWSQVCNPDARRFLKPNEVNVQNSNFRRQFWGEKLYGDIV